MISRILRRLRCIVTLNHKDPGVLLVGRRLYCKKCGKVNP